MVDVTFGIAASRRAGNPTTTGAASGAGSGRSTAQRLPWLARIAGTAVLCLAPRPALATFSIIAVDRDRGVVGAAVASCAGAYDLGRTPRVFPGWGVLIGQGSRSDETRDRALAMMKCGLAPGALLEQLRCSGSDSKIELRQYGVVDLLGRASGFTGTETTPYAEDRRGSSGAFRYSIQGNILDGASVLDDVEEAFRADHCDLAGRLMAALQAPNADGVGDSRCTEPRGISADSAHIEVVLPDGATLLDLTVTATEADDSVAVLAEQYDAWRAEHPCDEASTSTAQWDLATPDPCTAGCEEFVEPAVLSQCAGLDDGEGGRSQQNAAGRGEPEPQAGFGSGGSGRSPQNAVDGGQPGAGARAISAGGATSVASSGTTSEANVEPVCAAGAGQSGAPTHSDAGGTDETPSNVRVQGGCGLAGPPGAFSSAGFAVYAALAACLRRARSRTSGPALALRPHR
jgi:uncharacterized Ntn-hydrolase superfamily protein